VKRPTKPRTVTLAPHTVDVLQEWISLRGQRGIYATEAAAGLALALADLVAADAGYPLWTPHDPPEAA
jgi:hypothetical protein